MRRRTQFLGPALALVMAAGCSDSNAVSPTPAVDISFPSTSISVARGESKTFPVTVIRSGGFTGSVTIAVTGLPQDLSAGCSPSSVLSSSTTLTVAAGPSQSAGSYTATVKATGAGVATRTVLLTISVTS
jgi:hypothetical protein